MKFWISFFLITTIFCSISTSQIAVTDKLEKQRISFLNELLAKMTLDEKVGQLVQVVGPNKFHKDYIRNGKIGSILLGTVGAKEANILQKIAVEESRLRIPLLFANDVIHGYNTIFPIPLAEASSWNPELIEQASRIAAFEAASQGTHWTYAPMVDIARDPRWGRIMEGSGEDPYLGSIISAARVKGFQGENISDKYSIAACAKHFVAYGGAKGGKDYNSVDISDRELREIYLPPFKAAVDAGVETIMSAFNDLNGIPASANSYTLKKILREEWGFKGIVISDFDAIGELVAHGIAGDKKQAAFRGFDAGVDIDMVGDTLVGNVYLPNLANLIKEGSIKIEQLDNSVREVLDLKYRLGLFSNPYVDIEYYRNNMPSKSFRDSIALKLAKESIVLLKNENSLLPINDKVKSIVLIGPLANKKEDLLGMWAGNGDPNNVVSIYEGLENYLNKDVTLNYFEGCDFDSSFNTNFTDAISAAEMADLVIAVVGEPKSMSGEAASRATLNLPGMQLELIKELYKVNKNLIVVVMAGRPLAIPWMAENVSTILEGWYLGNQSGNAIAEVLLGYYNPSGKLPVTIPRSVGQIPLYYSHKNTGRPPTEYKFTSKYLDEEVTPLYPFGHGLSYTNFHYSNLKLSSDVFIGNDLYITVDIENVGDYDGEEIVQLYVKDKVASVTRPILELKRFKKIYIKAKKKKTVEFILNRNDFSFLDINLNKIIEPGRFDVFVGRSSADLISAAIEIIE